MAKKITGWLLAILITGFCIAGSRCTSAHIGGDTIKVFRNDIPFFRRRRYEDSTTMFLRDHYWSGRTRNDAAIHTSSGTIAIPRGSFISKTKGIIGPVVYVLRGEGFRAGLVLFGNAIDKNLSSVSVTQDGDVMGFSVRGGDTVKMAVNGIVFDALYMEADSKADYESKDYTNPYKQYIYFQCTGIEPIQIDKSSAIRFAADEAETKQFIMVIEENGYGLSAFTVTSSPEKPFLIEHPSLAAETMVSQVRFDTLFNKITAYKIGPDDEETVLPYEESEITTAGKSEQRLFAELLREALWRAQNNVSD